MFRRLPLLTLAATLACPATAHAQETPDDVVVTAQQAQKQVVSDGTIGVLGQQDALATPFNVTSYTAQLVLDQQSETIGDVLKNVAMAIVATAVHRAFPDLLAPRRTVAPRRAFAAS